jgi:lysophospholipase L1-like esterase
MRLSRFLLGIAVVATVALDAAPAGAALPTIPTTPSLLALLPVPAPPAGNYYVALGDSYASGPVIPSYEQPYGCLRSTNNYAHLVSRALALPMRDMSCAGAETEDMTSSQGVTPGPNPPQFDAISADTHLVTLQIGGNDIGFSDIASTSCLAIVPQGTPCQNTFVVNGQDEISRRIAEAAPQVTATVAALKARATNARIFVLGYPSIVPDTDGLATATCWPQLPISPQDIPWLRAKTKELNAMVASAAAANGVQYVDLYTPSIGHDSCQLPAIRWVEPLVIVGPAAPVHPNILGMLAISDILQAAIAH